MGTGLVIVVGGGDVGNCKGCASVGDGRVRSRLWLSRMVTSEFVCPHPRNGIVGAWCAVSAKGVDARRSLQEPLPRLGDYSGRGGIGWRCRKGRCWNSWGKYRYGTEGSGCWRVRVMLGRVEFVLAAKLASVQV